MKRLGFGYAEELQFCFFVSVLTVLWKCLRWLVDHMIELGFSKPLSEWIGSNLKNSGEHVTWAFNLDGAIQMFNSYRYQFFQIVFVNVFAFWMV